MCTFSGLLNAHWKLTSFVFPVSSSYNIETALTKQRSLWSIHSFVLEIIVGSKISWNPNLTFLQVIMLTEHGEQRVEQQRTFAHEAPEAQIGTRAAE